MAVWYFEYANLNANGSRPMGITVWAISLSTVKKTMSRLLLLIVSMGYGVVRSIIGGSEMSSKSRMMIVAILYIVDSEALLLIEHLSNINDFFGNAKLLVVLLFALIPALFSRSSLLCLAPSRSYSGSYIVDAAATNYKLPYLRFFSSSPSFFNSFLAVDYSSGSSVCASFKQRQLCLRFLQTVVVPSVLSSISFVCAFFRQRQFRLRFLHTSAVQSNINSVGSVELLILIHLIHMIDIWFSGIGHFGSPDCYVFS
ncbi:uncharacterized protein LOC127746690 [Arachis duranensis]|uniref:Uncharacterized protein LOC127746690 n=1 Tax=Arachis duranensis TaxID=130453 RepID=A0A9C6WV55_ARADU|nr:uncharacterized protein LOC127746690 [Arachis duranensis]